MAHRHVLAVALGGVLALTGCSDDPPSDAATSDAGTTDPSPTDAAADATGATPAPESTSEPSQPAESAAPDDDAGAGSVDVEAQIRHPNGTVLTVTGVTFEDPVVDVDMEVLNGYALEIYLHIQNWDELDGFDISDEADRTDGPGFVVADLPVSP